MQTLRLLFLSLLFYVLKANGKVAAQQNIIFITMDDMNAHIGVLGGHPQVSTPHIDSLAARGVLFLNSYTNSPVCASSRTSLLSGKDLLYTQAYNNAIEDDFRDNFTAAKNNAEVITLPEHLKNNGYYTFGINKVFHNTSADPDFDQFTTDPCEKDLSWSRISFFYNFPWVKDQMTLNKDGIPGYQWGSLDDSLELSLRDSRAVDTAIQFINDVASGAIAMCDGPFFLGLGLINPHNDIYVPEHFFPSYYVDDFYAEPYEKPYNDPINTDPPIGLVMPPQPDTIWNDYYHLGPIGQLVSQGEKDLESEFDDWLDDLDPIPEISDTLTTEERNFILKESKRANAVMAYIAGVQFADAQIGRLMDALEAHPDLYENTIVVLLGDNGFSQGEKRHWAKRSLWETDIRVPLIIANPQQPGNLVSQRTVSLLDIYPTLCDLVDIPEPTFMDGSPYLDGKNLAPLLVNPALKCESPVLVSWKAEVGKECNCEPQFAVRNERFHYIKYQSNNEVIGSLTCDPAGSIREEELYDVGENRETDPYEWYNLIGNDDYAPVIHYLQQFLPDSSLYLQKAHTVDILNNTLPCFLPSTYKLRLQSNLFNAEGALITGPLLADYQFKWTNSVTAAIQYGKMINFKINTIPAATFSSIDHIMFYLEVTQISTGKLVGFDTKTIYINPSNAPAVTFDLAIDDVLNSVAIENYLITGSYTDSYWDFGDGYTNEDIIPPVHTYASNGTYIITNTVEYGNNCVASYNETADLTLRLGEQNTKLLLFPNPASNYLHVITGQTLGQSHLSILNVLGQIVYKDEINGISDNLTINIVDFPPGNYILQIRSGDATAVGIFTVQH